jgi:hypothetical protein
MSATDVAAELLNSPPRIGHGKLDSLSPAKVLCIVTIAIRKTIKIFFISQNILNLGKIYLQSYEKVKNYCYLCNKNCMFLKLLGNEKDFDLLICRNWANNCLWPGRL